MDLYNASKWALNGFTFDWAKVLADKGVRVNNICMGATATEMLRGWAGPDADPEWVAKWMDPADTAEVLVQLIAEGPDGRTGDSIGLWVDHPVVLPPPEA
jgi:NAD(P)-dependent dehydrogenase (short-subunit alcohol dehydrogenase family)